MSRVTRSLREGSVGQIARDLAGARLHLADVFQIGGHQNGRG